MESLITELKARLSNDEEDTPRQASLTDMQRAKDLGFPEDILNFYSICEPTSCFELGVRIWSIENALIENKDGVPGLGLSPKGYLVFASTLCGDAYCVDTNAKTTDGGHPICLFSHESIDEDATDEEVARCRLQVADSFEYFLRLYLDGELNEEPNYG